MNEILNFMKCGLLETPNTRKEIRFVVYKFKDHIEKIIPFFKNYNLLGSKFFDYQDFSKVLLEKKKLRYFTYSKYKIKYE